MTGAGGYVRDTIRAVLDGWDRFWFAPTDPAMLGLIRILAGLMLFYTHLVWALNSEAFFGEQAWLSAKAVAQVQDGAGYWSHMWLFDSPAALFMAHAAALIVFACLTIGLFTRVSSILALLLTISYANRLPGALFGLDQINVMLAMYLAVGPSGAVYSLDDWRRRRNAAAPHAHAAPSVGANVALRLIQVHMCIIYLFAGIAKLQGAAWWNGTAMWGAVANLEYQSVDLTWLADWPRVINLMTHVTLFWELSYLVLIWPRRTRPIVLGLAIPLHLGIAFGLGMITFGLAMLIGNLAFVSSASVRSTVSQFRGGRLGAASRGGAEQKPDLACIAR